MYRFKKKEKAKNCIYYTDKIRHNLKKEKWQSFSACQIFFIYVSAHCCYLQ